MEPIQPIRPDGADPIIWRIGHRGFPKVAPENTMASFQKAVDAGADMIELDVALSKDLHPIVLHDETLNRTTNGKGRVAEQKAKDLKKLSAGSWFSKEFEGEKIPTLDEVFDRFADKVAFNIEIKQEAIGKKVQNLMALQDHLFSLIDTYKNERNIVVSSFQHGIVQAIKFERPEISTAILYSKMPKQLDELVVAIEQNNADAVHCNYRSLNPIWVEQLFMEMDCPFRIYTVNEKKVLEDFLKLPINGVFSDDLSLLKSMIPEQ